MNDIERTSKLKVYRFPSQEKYHCQQCRHEIPFKNRKDIDFNYCPYCGESLFGKERTMDNKLEISQEQAKMLLQIIVALMLGTPEEAETLLRAYIEESKGEIQE